MVSCLQYSLVIHTLRCLAHRYFKDVDHDGWWLVFLMKFRQPGALAPWLQVAAIVTVVSGPTSSLSVHRVRISVASRNEFHRSSEVLKTMEVPQQSRGRLAGVSEMRLATLLLLLSRPSPSLRVWTMVYVRTETAIRNSRSSCVPIHGSARGDQLGRMGQHLLHSLCCVTALSRFCPSPIASIPSPLGLGSGSGRDYF